jgi:hypothetical protein
MRPPEPFNKLLLQVHTTSLGLIPDEVERQCQCMLSVPVAFHQDLVECAVDPFEPAELGMRLVQPLAEFELSSRFDDRVSARL